MALMAQQTHVLEPSIMEVAYHEISGKYNDDYALRVGKSMSQYFSYHKLRDDSLSSNAQTSMIILQEMLDEATTEMMPPSKGQVVRTTATISIEAKPTILLTHIPVLWDKGIR